ncbi:MAG: Gfo/Idh/MocA family oxidoreductase [Clostridia bacterium]|nr:Gfo/Idh/MocA family oxidoreductase [Clostridia bacterium]
MLEFAIVGFGNRGSTFAKLLKNEKRARLVAVAEVDADNRKLAQTQFGVKAERCFSSADEFFEKGKICDAVILCTQDAQHREMAIRAMRLGYELLLEKPAATTLEDCIAIRDTANGLGRKVMLAHGLRYAPFFYTIKKLISEGKLGEVVTVNQTENIAFWHFALSYVRGPWRNMAASTPTILAKCCHDLDLIAWFMNKKCKSVSSFGGLQYFRPECAPEGSAKYCVDCNAETRKSCLYNAYEVYTEAQVQRGTGGTRKLIGKDVKGLIESRAHEIGRCVYHGDNDAVDHQVVNLLYEGGATAHLTMTAFSQRCYRFVKVHGTKGEVYGDAGKGILHYTPFGGERQEIDVNNAIAVDDAAFLGHGGGDYFLLMDFIGYLLGEEKTVTRTTIDESIESHIIGFKAEESRLNGGAMLTIER